MLKSDDIKVGTKVRCVAPGSFYRMVGTITRIDFDGYGNKYWDVRDLFSKRIGMNEWCEYKSFELWVDMDELIEVVDEPSKEEVVEVIYQSTRPCPSYYFGAAHCTCGKCNIHKTVFR